MRRILDRYLWGSYRQLSMISYWIARRFTTVGKLVLALMFASGLIGIDIQRVQSYQLFIVLLMLIVIALLSSIRKKVHMSATRQLPKYACVGEKMTYQVTLTNTNNNQLGHFSVRDLPIDPRPSMELFLTSQEPRSVTKSRFDRFFRFPRWRWLVTKNTVIKTIIADTPALASHASVTLSLTLEPVRRGTTQLIAMEILQPDSFGLYRATTTIPCYESLIVLPKRYQVPALNLSGRRQHNIGGVNNASSVGDAQEFTSLREYQPGDSIRNIHWQSWAKTSQPIVKQYQEEYFARYGLILDTFCDDANAAQFEEAVSLAASFVSSLTSLDSIIDLMFVSNKAYQISTGRGVTQRENLLEILASVAMNENNNVNALHAIITKNITILSSAILIFVTWDEQRQNIVKILQHNNIAYRAFVILDEQQSKNLIIQDNNVTILQTNNIEAGLALL